MSWEALERRYARDPLPTDDEAHGYNTRWEWLNTSTGNRFQCNNASNGAAVWVASPSSDGFSNIIVLTQTEYDAIVTKDANALYVIVGA